MAIKTEDLYQIAGLNSDGVLGFQMQVQSRRISQAVLWPEHFAGSRITDFEKGSWIARQYLAHRNGTGVARRWSRLEELRSTGGIITRGPWTASEHRKEQLEALRGIVERMQQAERLVAAESRAEACEDPTPEP